MVEAARAVKLLAMDVDGVLTVGDIIYSSSGEEIRAFSILDGLGLTVARHGGLLTAVITGRRSAPVERRAEELRITDFFEGCRDKSAAIRSLMAKYGLAKEQVAFVGDDINDIPAFREVGWKVAVANASPDLKALSDYVTEAHGGRGAVREVIELILRSQGAWEAAVSRYLAELEATDERAHHFAHQ